MLNRPWNIYAEELFPLGYGHPLWYAEANFTTGRQVLVGDIGILHESQFRPLFNTLKPGDDPLNQGNVPDSFQPLALPSGITRTDLLTQPILVSEGITLQGETNDPTAGHRWTFRSHADAGAVLVQDPPGVADALDVRTARPAIINYMRENLDAWRSPAYVQQSEIGDRDILFVCGTVKTTRWGTAAVRDRDFRGREGRVSGDLAWSNNRAFYVEHVLWDYTMTGPLYRAGGPRPEGASQCLFMHYFKMKRFGAASGDDLVESRGRPIRMGGYIVERCPSTPPPEMDYDPVNCLLDYILKNSEAPFAAASDMDVTDLFRGQPFPKLDQLPRAIKRASPRIEIDEHDVGTISIAHAPVH
ncbi:hypothetical protein GSI_11931 [Ganoderma sinense ZZ0214-1]|uniref:Uncharacterized protein n=1 Tax=Ganoderma sinense ZZ0214-1 TaxID=1077348 RepID=A0A2G8RXD3_9APHY|nr:hypothetical protein GSI_11931 [Ganoderma sinense ZZ0214-1]